ncbi:hypothetical protein Tsubulata_040726 [Turnera subulata]|uniref:RING-type E3 ubiquitin transferase n=1 Tax=Turnera subulata TaxID=218843 RepID=A0A9Q0FN63_9ROSI|nr:hypothetical protein Tsubulata_040726 [Turnera subulata]
MGRLDDTATVEITGKIMVIAIIILFLVVVFVLFLHLYAKWFWWRIEEPPAPARRRRRRRFVFTPGQELVRRGLEVSVLKSLPEVVFDSKDFKDGLECAVCLCEVEEGEKARLLPKCNHGFHLDCIDMWFQSHSTCPLCRNSVAPVPNVSSSYDVSDVEANVQSPDELLASGFTRESPNFPTNVLFWGDHQTQVSTGGVSMEEGTSSSSDSAPSASVSTRLHEILVVDVPVSDYSAEDQESKTPTPTRLRTLKRLLSRDRKMAPSCSGSSAEV